MNQVPESKKGNKNNSFSTLLSHFILSGTFLKKKKIIYFAVPGLRWGMQDLVFLSRDGTQAPCMGSMES